MKKYVHKLTKGSPYSYHLVIPREIVEKYGWREKQKMTIEDVGRGELKIKDWRRK